MTQNKFWTLSFGVAILTGYVAGCANSAEQCEKVGTCKPEGVGGTSSETGGTGGKSSTGGSSGTHKGGTGGIASASSGGKAGASTTAPCNGACTGTKPICDTDKNECVECTKSDDCKTDATKPVCNATKGACVACNENNDCKDATASRCDTATNTCSACSIDDDCKQIDGKSVCSVGVCVQCTVTNEKACSNDANSCNPKTNTCTGTAKGSRKICQSCQADDECENGNVSDPTTRCAEMKFNGATRTTGYCLQRSAKVAQCPRPYTVVVNAVSLSGSTSEAYCGINQELTTCEAVLDMISADAVPACTGDDNRCGCSRDASGICTTGGLGGLCRQLGGGTAPPYLCTIPCGKDDQCSSGSKCLPSANGYCQ